MKKNASHLAFICSHAAGPRPRIIETVRAPSDLSSSASRLRSGAGCSRTGAPSAATPCSCAPGGQTLPSRWHDHLPPCRGSIQTRPTLLSASWTMAPAQCCASSPSPSFRPTSWVASSMPKPYSSNLTLLEATLYAEREGRIRDYRAATCPLCNLGHEPSAEAAFQPLSLEPRVLRNLNTR